MGAGARLRRAGWLAGWVWLAVAVIFLPASAAVAARLLGNVFSWRIFWALPVPLLVAVAAGLASDGGTPRRALRRAALALWLLAFAAAGPWAISAADWSWSNVDEWKMPDAPCEAAALVARVAAPDGRAVVPEPVAVCLVGLPDAPPLVAVRALYLRKLEGVIPPDDLARRMDLLLFADGRASVPPLAYGLALIDRAGLATVAFPAGHRDAAGLGSALAARGFSMHDAAGYVVATRGR
jgi:hypothetical protein